MNTASQSSTSPAANIVIENLDEFAHFNYFCGSTSADYISSTPSAAS